MPTKWKMELGNVIADDGDGSCPNGQWPTKTWFQKRLGKLTLDKGAEIVLGERSNDAILLAEEAMRTPGLV